MPRALLSLKRHFFYRLSDFDGAQNVGRRILNPFNSRQFRQTTDGCISVTANVAPRLCRALHNAWALKDFETLAEMGLTIHYRIPVPELSGASQKALTWKGFDLNISTYGAFGMQVAHTYRKFGNGQFFIHRVTFY